MTTSEREIYSPEYSDGSIDWLTVGVIAAYAIVAAVLACMLLS